MTDITSKTLETPVGLLWLVARGNRLWASEFEPRWSSVVRSLQTEGTPLAAGVRRGRNPVLTHATKAIRAYFAGDLRALRPVKLDLTGTEFQRNVWKTVRGIRPGRTLSYGALAERVNRAGSFRAVGAANGANRCALFVPCHRVVAKNGRLVGYGGGVDAKAFLLEHEGVHVESRR